MKYLLSSSLKPSELDSCIRQYGEEVAAVQVQRTEGGDENTEEVVTQVKSLGVCIVADGCVNVLGIAVVRVARAEEKYRGK